MTVSFPVARLQELPSSSPQVICPEHELQGRFSFSSPCSVGVANCHGGLYVTIKIIYKKNINQHKWKFILEEITAKNNIE